MEETPKNMVEENDFQISEEEKETPKNQEEEEKKPETPAEKTDKNQEEDLLKKFQSAEAQKEHFRAKAEKLQKELEESKKQIPKEEKPQNPQDPKVIVRLAKSLEKFNEEEIDFIYRNAKDSNPDSVVEATKDPWVIEAIEARRAKVVKEEKIPDSSGTTSSRKSLTDKDLAEMPREEHEKLFRERLKEREGI